VGTSVDAALPARLANLKLVESSGKTTSLAALHGKVVLISDVMTLCQESCPIATSTFVATANAIRKAGLADKVEFLSITVDPKRDTPAQLAAYRKLFKPTPRNWLAVTGEPAGLNALWKYLGVYHKKVPNDSPAPRNWRTGARLTYDIEHSDEVFFFDQTGHERFVLEGTGKMARGDTLPPTMRAFLDPAGVKALKHPTAGAWTVTQATEVIGWLTGQHIGHPRG
jgi:protein SCO1/2